MGHMTDSLAKRNSFAIFSERPCLGQRFKVLLLISSRHDVVPYDHSSTLISHLTHLHSIVSSLCLSLVSLVSLKQGPDGKYGEHEWLTFKELKQKFLQFGSGLRQHVPARLVAQV